MKKTLFLGLLAMAFAVGCGDDETENPSSNLSQQEVAQGFAAFGAAIGEASNVDLSTGTADATCAEGGSVTFSGTEDPATGSFNVTITYNGCTNNGITINGSITASGTIQETGASSITVSGSVTFSGAVNGTCGMNYSVTTTVDGQNVSVSASGNICGISASGLAGG